VIVSREVVDASDGAPVAFRDVGPVALKGLSAPIVLYAAAARS
jgi:class 3 adenylate cyclase